MSAVTAGQVYELFFLAASGAMGLVALGTHVLGRRIGHRQALVGTLALVGSFTFAGAYGGLPPAVARVPVAIAVAFLYVPVGVAWPIVRLVTDHSRETVARVFPGAWMAGLVIALVTQALGANLAGLVADTPALFGVDGYVGFLAYNAAVGVVVGLICLPLLAHEDRGTLATITGRGSP